jgi:hypothetical protein
MASERAQPGLGSLRSFTLAEGILLLVLGVSGAGVSGDRLGLGHRGGGARLPGGRHRRLGQRPQRAARAPEPLASASGAWWSSTLFVVAGGCGSFSSSAAGLVPAAGLQVAALAFAIGIVFLVEGVVAIRRGSHPTGRCQGLGMGPGQWHR